MALLVSANMKLIDTENNSDPDITAEKFSALHKLREYIEHHGEIKIAYVLPMTSIRRTIKKVFRLSKNGLKAEMVKGPTDIVGEMYDIRENGGTIDVLYDNGRETPFCNERNDKQTQRQGYLSQTSI